MTHSGGKPKKAVELDSLRETLDQWRVTLDADDDDLTAGREFCAASELDTATLRKAIGLVVETWPSDPDGWPRDSMLTSPAEHLAMIVAGIEAELISGDPGDGDTLWRKYRHGPYSDEHQAAYQALERTGALHYLESMDDLLDQGRRIADNVGDCPQWVEVDDIGWVVFAQA